MRSYVFLSQAIAIMNITSIFVRELYHRSAVSAMRTSETDHTRIVSDLFQVTINVYRSLNHNIFTLMREELSQNH